MAGGTRERVAFALVRRYVDKYDTGRALPRPRRRPPSPDRGPRRRRRGSPGRRARAGPGVRHQPGHSAPRPRPVAPGGAGDEPPGRGVVRGPRPRAPAPRAGHDGRSRGRGRRCAPGARDPRVRFRRRAGCGRRRPAGRPRFRCAARRAGEPRRRRAVRVGDGLGPRRRRRRRVARRRRALAVLRPAAAAGVELGSVHQTITAEIASAERAALLACAPGAPLLLCRRVTHDAAGAAHARSPSTAIPPTVRRSRSSSR